LGVKIHKLYTEITELRESLDEKAYGEHADIDALYHHLKKARVMTDYLVLRMEEQERTDKAPSVR
jgi:hypothetical protein